MAIIEHQNRRGSGYLIGFAFEKLTVGSASATGAITVANGVGVLSTGTFDDSASDYGLSVGVGQPADRAVILVSGASVRYLYDGTVPSTAQGLQAGSLDIIKLEGNANLKLLQVVRESATAGAAEPTLHVIYERFKV